jgi:hypothetical protein
MADPDALVLAGRSIASVAEMIFSGLPQCGQYCGTFLYAYPPDATLFAGSRALTSVTRR